MTISELTQAVHRIPEIQQQSARLSVHVDLLSRLNQHFKERKLETPISLEQKIITRHASVDGPKVSEKEIEAELIPFLQNDTYSTAERSRVLLLYAMTLGGDMKRLRELVVKTANMKIDERLLELCATQLTHDAWKLSTEGEKRLKNALKKKGDKNKKGKDGAATMLYDLSRSVPIIRTVAQLLTRGLLPEETFPRVADIAATGRNPTEGLHGGKPAAIAPTSLRKATAATSWANPFRQGKQTTPMRTIEVTASHTMKVQGPRYVLFILGGLTYSEMKHIHDVISEESVEMYAGGTTSLSPDEFLRALHEKATTL